MMDCNTVEELLSAYLREELTVLSHDEVSIHLANCPSCQNALNELEAIKSLCKKDVRPSLEQETAKDILGNIKAQIACEEALAATKHDIMTVEEAAAYLRVTPRELEEEFDTLPVFTIGGQLRIRRSRLLTWVEERERKTRGRRLFSLVNE